MGASIWTFCCDVVCHFYFSSLKMFLHFQRDWNLSILCCLSKTEAFFVILDYFLARKESNRRVRQIVRFYQHYRKTKISFASFYDIKKNKNIQIYLMRRILIVSRISVHMVFISVRQCMWSLYIIFFHIFFPTNKCC